MPLLLAYWTVDLTDDARITFKTDVYGHDAALLKALDATAPAFVPVTTTMRCRFDSHNLARIDRSE